MKGYMIVTYRRSADAETMAAYAALAVPALSAHGARFLVRVPAGAVEWRECGSGERVVVLEFPSKEHAIKAYDSEAYQAAVALLSGKAERDVGFVEGYAGPER